MKKRVQSRIYKKIYENYYGVKVPKGMHIHHIDGNRENNDPLNLKLLTPEEHFSVHLKQGDMVCRHGKFLQGASEAGKKGGKSKSPKKIKACSENMKRNRRPDLGAKASVEARKKAKTFFFSETYQAELKNRLKQHKIGPYSDKHKEMVRLLGKSKGKKPIFGDKKWFSSYEASLETNLPASTIRYRCRNNIKGWSYE
jgi:hypothetical protein